MPRNKKPSGFGGKPRGRSKRPVREQGRYILIVCEGEQSEIDYFNFMRQKLRQAGLAIHPTGVGRDPLSVVREALRQREYVEKNGTQVDEVWVVVDVDDHATLKDAKALAEANSIPLVVSNPCFELWLLLHAQEWSRSDSSQNLNRAANKAGVMTYKAVVSTALEGNYALARDRALSLEAMHLRAGNATPDDNPATQVHRVVHSVLLAAEATGRLRQDAWS